MSISQRDLNSLTHNDNSEDNHLPNDTMNYDIDNLPNSNDSNSVIEDINTPLDVTVTENNN